MSKNPRVKAGLQFGIGMTIFFIAQNLLFNDHDTTKDVIKSITIGLLSGVLSGVLYGWLIGRFLKSKSVTESTKIQTDADENILFETPANHFKGVEAVGGKLYLTSKRIIFKSHKLNIQNHQLSIKLTDIETFDRYKTLGLVNNGLSIITSDQKTEKFVVSEIEQWMDNLNKYLP